VYQALSYEVKASSRNRQKKYQIHGRKSVTDMNQTDDEPRCLELLFSCLHVEAVRLAFVFYIIGLLDASLTGGEVEVSWQRHPHNGGRHPPDRSATATPASKKKTSGVSERSRDYNASPQTRNEEVGQQLLHDCTSQ